MISSDSVGGRAVRGTCEGEKTLILDFVMRGRQKGTHLRPRILFWLRRCPFCCCRCVRSRRICSEGERFRVVGGRIDEEGGKVGSGFAGTRRRDSGGSRLWVREGQARTTRFAREMRGRERNKQRNPSEVLPAVVDFPKLPAPPALLRAPPRWCPDLFEGVSSRKEPSTASKATLLVGRLPRCPPRPPRS